jgi:hypothetical protein
MLTRHFFLAAPILIFILTGCAAVGVTAPATQLSAINPHLPFIMNQGQLDRQIAYYAPIFGGTVHVTGAGDIVYFLSHPDKDGVTNRILISEELVNGNVHNIIGREEILVTISDFHGSGPSKWQSNVPAYRIISFEEIYEGIDLQLKAFGENVEKFFIIKPGADPNHISLNVSGCQSVQVNSSGQLEVITGEGVITFTKPLAYQEICGEKIDVNVAYVIEGTEYSFAIGQYDHNQTLVIDPLIGSTFLGGSSTEDDYDPSIAVDDDGNVFMTGFTTSNDFPTTPGVYNDDYSDYRDVFVAKLDNNLSTLIAATFIGGSADEWGSSILIDNNGDVYVGGYTESEDFPTIEGCYTEEIQGSRDAFIFKLSNNLTALQASTYLGGSNSEGYQWPKLELTMDAGGNIYVVGLTRSSDFPTSPAAYDTLYNGGSGGGDAFAAKFNGDLTALLASTFLGGSDYEWRISIVLDESENVYTCGETGSADFPTLTGAYNESLNGSSDVFMSCMNNDFSELLFSTLFGSIGYEEPLAIDIDSEGNIYIAGYTFYPGFPTTPGAIYETYNGGERDAFISKFTGDLSNLIVSTFWGGNQRDDIRALQLDSLDNVCIIGNTISSDFPTTYDAYSDSLNGGSLKGDAYLARINKDLDSLLNSTLIGGSYDDCAISMDIDAAGNIFVAGYTQSLNFPALPNAQSPQYNGGSTDGFIAKFIFDQFTRITEDAFGTDSGPSQGVGWVDYDNDSFLDLYVSNMLYPSGYNNFMYDNDGTGNLVKNLAALPANYGGASRGITWGDYDNDGDLDLYVTDLIAYNNAFYANNGDDTFTKITESPIDNNTSAGTAASWVDYDNDGRLDIYISQYGANQLFHNEPGGFTGVTAGPQVTDGYETYGIAFSDYDNDRDQDLFVCIIGEGSPYKDNLFYVNNGDGTFTRITDQDFVNDGGMSPGASWGDYNNDGHMDLFVTNIPDGDNGNNFLYQNNGDGTLTKISEGVVVTDGGYSFGSTWGDFDNDGDLDLFVANYNLGESNVNFLYYNQGNGTFVRATGEAIATDINGSVGAACGDYDNDGDLDIFVANSLNDNETNALYRNNGNPNNWLKIKCIGSRSNRAAIGTVIRLKAQILGIDTWQMREISGQTGYCSQNSLIAHFGLGDALIVDSIKVEWPSGWNDIFTQVDVNQFITIIETLCGDANGDKSVNIGDAVYIINFVFHEGNDPLPYEAGDVNCDGSVNVGDAVYLGNVIFRPGSPEPCAPCD